MLAFLRAGQWQQEAVYVRRRKRKAAADVEGAPMEAQQRLLLGTLPIAYRHAPHV